MLDSKPLVSIVLPTYNRADSLARAIETCLAQTYKQIELLIINDGSTDHTAQVADDYALRDSRVRVFHRQNVGLPKALNAGFLQAQGEWLTWTSDDNCYLPNAIEQLLAGGLQAQTPCLVYADYWMWNAETDTRREVAHPEGETLADRNIVGACFLYHRDIPEQIGFYDPDYFLAEDYEYWLRISCRFPVVHVPLPLYLYSVHPQTLTSLRSFEIKAIALVVRRKYKRLGSGTFLRAFRKNLSRLFRAELANGSQWSTAGIILKRSGYLLLRKRLPASVSASTPKSAAPLYSMGNMLR